MSNMTQQDFNQGLLDFLGASPTPFHAVATMAEQLEAAGFTALDEGDHWELQSGGRYYCTRNGSSLIAFVVGKQNVLQNGLRLVGAHTDSPCFTVKPEPEVTDGGYFQLGVEVYGGVLLNPWFDRDLSIAGRVVYRGTDKKLYQKLVDFKKPVACIPSLAIHLDRKANEERTVNPQTDMPPLVFQVADGRYESFVALLAGELLQEESVEDVLSHELYLYDTQPPALTGLYQDFIASARLDNLLSCYTGLRALLEAGDKETSLLVCNDHEEVGSASACGAQGPMLQSVLERLVPDNAERTRCISRSLMISADNAHGVHPNYRDKHDGNHGPLLNKGPVIKVNSKQRYATNSVTAGLFRELCRQVAVPVQSFVSRADMGCGSTIGPITATEIGVPTLDIGVPTFAMHSVRELAGTVDAYYLYQVLKRFYVSSLPGLV